MIWRYQHQLIRAHPWVVRDAREDFIRAQLKGIIGARNPRLVEGQPKPAGRDRVCVAAGVGGTTGEAEILDLVKRYGRLEGTH